MPFCIFEINQDYNIKLVKMRVFGACHEKIKKIINFGKKINKKEKKIENKKSNNNFK